MARKATARPERAGGDASAIVLDNSVVMAWSFEDEASDYADSVLDALKERQAFVPGLWPLEVANVLLVGERRNRISQAGLQKCLRDYAALPITVDDDTGHHAWSSTLDLARAQQLSVYDAAYLELAMRRGLPLATLDAKLQRTAAAVGVPLFSVRR